MPFPITPAQAISLGVAAQTVGSAAAATFADMLRGAGDLLSNLGPAGSGGSPGPSSVKGPAASSAGGTSDVAVLKEQIHNMLASLHAGVQALFADAGKSLPADGVTLADGGVFGLKEQGDSRHSASLGSLLAGNESLTELFRGIAARSKLLQMATGKEPAAEFAVRVTPQSATPVSS